MTRLRELLADADPVTHEAGWAADDRLRVRQAVIDGSRQTRRAVSRRSAAVALAAALVVAAGGVLVWPGATPTLTAAIRFEIHLADEGPAPGLREVVVSGSNRRIYLHPDPIVVNGDIAETRVVPGNGGAFGVAVTFTREGAAKMRRATEAHIGRPLAILLDGQVVAAPVVRSAISDSAVLSGDFTREAAERIAAGVKGV
jgi:hypothetical protein